MTLKDAAQTLATDEEKLALVKKKRIELNNQITELHQAFREIQKVFDHRKRLYESALRKHQQIDKLLAETRLVQQQKVEATKKGTTKRSPQSARAIQEKAKAALANLPQEIAEEVIKNFERNQG